MTTAEGHELLRKRRHSKLQSINGMEAKSIIVASAPSFHELQCMYWHGSCSVTDPRAPGSLIFTASHPQGTRWE